MLAGEFGLGSTDGLTHAFEIVSAIVVALVVVAFVAVVVSAVIRSRTVRDPANKPGRRERPADYPTD